MMNLLKMNDEEFNNKVQSIIIGFSIVLSLIIFFILSVINFRFSVSFLLCYVISIFIFLKNNILITYFLTARLDRPRFWMTLNNILNMSIYLGITYLLVKISYFSLVGIIGLFIIALATFLISIIKRK